MFAAGEPLISALIVTSDVKGAASLITQIRKQKPSLPVILLSPNRNAERKGADHHLSRHEPQELLQLCRELLGDPRTIDEQQRVRVTKVTSARLKTHPENRITTCRHVTKYLLAT